VHASSHKMFNDDTVIFVQLVMVRKQMSQRDIRLESNRSGIAVGQVIVDIAKKFRGGIRYAPDDFSWVAINIASGHLYDIAITGQLRQSFEGVFEHLDFSVAFPESFGSGVSGER